MSSRTDTFPALSPLAPFPAKQAVVARTTRLRGLLLLACSAAVALGFLVGQADDVLRSEPQLAFLLRGMALIKASMVLAVVGLMWWRFKRPVGPMPAAIYVVGSAVLAGACALIWQLSFIPLAAGVFHLAGLAVLVAAWRDGMLTPRRSR